LNPEQLHARRSLIINVKVIQVSCSTRFLNAMFIPRRLF
jgi:hypothetical protein